MIYPSIGELLGNSGINRYTLVVATAKCARIITDEYVKQREYAEKLAIGKDAEKSKNIANMIKREYRDEKAVKLAVSGLYSGEFKLIMPDGKEVFLGASARENVAETVSNENSAEEAKEQITE